MSVQQSLSTFTTSGWDIVDQWRFEDGVGVRCPDCGHPTAVGYWPVDNEAADAVHGVGCEHCRTVVPFPPPSERKARLGHGIDRLTVTTRAGEEIDIGGIGSVGGVPDGQ